MAPGYSHVAPRGPQRNPGQRAPWGAQNVDHQGQFGPCIFWKLRLRLCVSLYTMEAIKGVLLELLEASDADNICYFADMLGVIVTVCLLLRDGVCSSAVEGQGR